MKRDMELCRKILLAIEELYVDAPIYNLKIEGYFIEQIAYHCKILKDANLISDYKALYGDNRIVNFGVGSLTAEGNNYLDKIRNESVWNKVKDTVREKGIPLTIESITRTLPIVINNILSS